MQHADQAIGAGAPDGLGESGRVAVEARRGQEDLDAAAAVLEQPWNVVEGVGVGIVEDGVEEDVGDRLLLCDGGLACE